MACKVPGANTVIKDNQVVADRENNKTIMEFCNNSGAK